MYDLHDIAKKLPTNTTMKDVQEAIKSINLTDLFSEDEVIVMINKATFDRIMNARKAD